MLTLSISGLIAAYILIAILLLSLNLYSKWSWPVKAGTNVLAAVFYVITYMSFPPLLGWATEELPPPSFRLLATHVEQPDKITGEEGTIYLWAASVEDLATISAPRAYKFHYSNELYEKVIAANAKLHKNVPVLGQYEEFDERGKLQVDEDSRRGLKSIDIQFYDMPDPLIPDK